MVMDLAVIFSNFLNSWYGGVVAYSASNTQVQSFGWGNLFEKNPNFASSVPSNIQMVLIIKLFCHNYMLVQLVHSPIILGLDFIMLVTENLIRKNGDWI